LNGVLTQYPGEEEEEENNENQDNNVQQENPANSESYLERIKSMRLNKDYFSNKFFQREYHIIGIHSL